MIKIIFIILLILHSSLITSCVSGTTNNVQTLPMNITSDMFVENSIDSLEIIPLKMTNTEAYIRTCNSMKIDNNGIYISDLSSKKINSFDHSGQFITTYGRIGKVPNNGEYLEAIAYAIDDNTVYIVDNFNKKLFKYNKYTGKYISNIELPNYYYDIEILDNGNFIFVWYPRIGEYQDNAKYKLTIADSSMNIISQLGEATEDDSYTGKFYFLSKYDDKISYHALYQDSIQILSRHDGHKITTYSIEIANKMPNTLKKNQDPYSDSKEHLKYDFIVSMYGSPIIKDEHIYGNLFTGNTTLINFFDYDIENKKCILNGAKFSKFLAGYSFCYYEGFFYYCIPSSVVDDILKTMKKLKCRNIMNYESDFYIVRFAINKTS